MRGRAGLLAVLIVGCTKAPASPSPATAPTLAPESTVVVFMLGVIAPRDSAVKLARFAMGIVDGVDELPQTRKEGVVVARRYTQSRRGGGHTDVAIIAIVQRPERVATETTFVQLSAWALETRADLPMLAPRRRASPASAAADRPQVAMRPNQPRRITPSDTVNWAMLQLVLAEFTRSGAQRVP
jgi:hypothetical protein